MLEYATYLVGVEGGSRWGRGVEGEWRAETDRDTKEKANFLAVSSFILLISTNSSFKYQHFVNLYKDQFSLMLFSPLAHNTR